MLFFVYRQKSSVKLYRTFHQSQNSMFILHHLLNNIYTKNSLNPIGYLYLYAIIQAMAWSQDIDTG